MILDSTSVYRNGFATTPYLLYLLRGGSFSQIISINHHKARSSATCPYHFPSKRIWTWESLGVNFITDVFKLCRLHLAGTFALTLTSRLIKVMENLELKFYLGEDATSAQCTLSSAGSSVGSVGSADGSWSFNSRTKVRFDGGSCCPKLTPFRRSDGRFSICGLRGAGFFEVHGHQSKQFANNFIDLRCLWFSRIKAPRPAHAFQIRFEIPSYSFSSLKVDQLRLSSETYKMYKGVRMRSKGSIEWRW